VIVPPVWLLAVQRELVCCGAMVDGVPLEEVEKPVCRRKKCRTN
jgi:hypothetical protein